MPFISLLSLSVALKSIKPYHGFHLPINKDPSTLQYYTCIQMGTPPVKLDVVIDIRERFLWFECGNNYNSSTYKPLNCATKQCKIAKGTDCINCTNHPLKTGCTNNTCGVQPYNPFGEFFVSGDVGEDILSSTYITNGSSLVVSNTYIPSFISSCVYPDKFGIVGFLEGAKGKKGVLGLAMTSISLPSQLANKYKLHHKFALCLPSTSNEKGHNNGDLFVGADTYYFFPHLKASKILNYTPFVFNCHSTGPIFDNDPSTEYFIRLKSMKVDNQVVKFNSSLLSINKEGHGGTKLSTVIPYTKLHTSIYQPLVNYFVNKASVRKIKRVEAVAPFGACFDSRTINNSISGPDVPTIDLLLKGGVKWRIYGANSMVKVDKKNVLCLAFVDGGLEPTTPLATSIVIGGHQLEDHFLEFDLLSLKFGFTSSLLLRNSSCSHSSTTF
ncbi:hypothetical protein Lal_00041041 [Lupinus albus]|uniref:Putative nepenthesin n=1 Tax=Lupinus albus TaxID=3870 RepID=A0A6A5NQD6_LUPAL|nr:putative nepenthesin [Lupinus albus]KAF1887439.1 hypothetical protein Lal_00041041 [Lupinus albus]